MVLYGWLVTRSPVAPSLIGVMSVIAGVGWCSGPMPGLPSQVRLGAQGFGAITEVVFAVWLLGHG
jgi:hypothetical protein